MHALLAKDPKFDRAAFEARVRAAFLAVQTAWNARDLSGVRHLLSDGTHERFSALLALNDAQGMRNRTENLQIEAAEIEGLTCGSVYDLITVRFNASCRDLDLKLSGEILRDESTNFTEGWTFVRRASAASIPKGLMEGNCPSCGAGISLNEVTACAHCAALVTSGEYDWVLSEITQVA